MKTLFAYTIQNCKGLQMIDPVKAGLLMPKQQIAAAIFM